MFVLANGELNSVKARIWTQIAPRDRGKFSKDVNDWLYECQDAGKFLRYLRAARAVFSYLNDPEVASKFRAASNSVKEQLLYTELNTQDPPRLSEMWSLFIP